MKKVRLHSEVMWYSAPVHPRSIIIFYKYHLTSLLGTNTETDKGIFVGSRGTEIKFPLKLTATTRKV